MNTPVGKVLKSKGSEVYTVAPATTVAAAVVEMNHEEIGALLVVEYGRLVGIFTERDVLTRVVALNRNPQTTLVSAVMTPDPITITSATTFEEALCHQSGRHFRHLPVVEGDRIIGMISCRDMLQWMADVNSARAEKLEEFIESGGCVG